MSLAGFAKTTSGALCLASPENVELSLQHIPVADDSPSLFWQSLLWDEACHAVHGMHRFFVQRWFCIRDHTAVYGLRRKVAGQGRGLTICIDVEAPCQVSAEGQGSAPPSCSCESMNKEGLSSVIPRH